MTSHSSQNSSSASVCADNRTKCRRAHQLYAYIQAKALEFFYYGPTGYVLHHLTDRSACESLEDDSTFLSVEPQYGFQTIHVHGPKEQQEAIANLSTFGHFDEEESRSTLGFSPDKVLSSTPLRDRDQVSGYEDIWMSDDRDIFRHLDLEPALKIFDGQKGVTARTPTGSEEEFFASGELGEMEDQQQGNMEFESGHPGKDGNASRDSFSYGPDNIPDAADDAFESWWKDKGGIVVEGSESTQPMLQISRQQLKLILTEHYRFPDFVVLLNHLNAEKTEVTFKEPVALVENKRDRLVAGPGIDNVVGEQVRNQVRYCFNQYPETHSIPSIAMMGKEWIWTDWDRSKGITAEVRGSSLLEEDTELGWVYNKVFQDKWTRLVQHHKMTCRAFDY